MRGPNATTFVPRPIPPRPSHAAQTRPYDPNSKRPSCVDGASCTTRVGSFPRDVAGFVEPGTDGPLVSDVTTFGFSAGFSGGFSGGTTGAGGGGGGGGGGCV